jgi:hypothetical protein
VPRQRGSSPRKHVTPTRIQDGTGLEARIFNTFIDDFITPIEIRIEALEGVLDSLAALTRFSFETGVVELKKGKRGGTTYLDPEGGIEAAAVGRPVIINQAPNGDSDEDGIVQFTGEVISLSRIRVRWHAAGGAPKSVPVVYLIG